MQKSTLIRRILGLGLGLVLVGACGTEAPEASDSAAIEGLDPSQEALSEAFLRKLQPPPECSRPRLRRMYGEGFQRGQRIARMLARDHRRLCDHIEEYTDVLMQRIERADEIIGNESTPMRRRCIFVGGIDGSTRVLENKYERCTVRCSRRGRVHGKIAALTYCRLAIESQGNLDVSEWIRGPLNYCGLYYETECDTKFMADTYSFENEQGVCKPYTSDEYFNMWDNSRLKACGYRLSQRPRT